MFSRSTVLVVLAASAALMSVDAFAPPARIVSYTPYYDRDRYRVKLLLSPPSNGGLGNPIRRLGVDDEYALRKNEQ